MTEILDAFSSPIFQRAILAAIVASIACGIIGSFVVVQRASSISGGIAHAALGGVGIGYFLGFSPVIGATLVAVISALIISYQYLHSRENLDTLVSIVWSVGMAIGVLLISLTPGYPPDLANFLFGSIVYVPENYLYTATALVAVIALVVWRYFHFFQAITFDEDFARARGINLPCYYTLLLVLTALAVVTLLRVVGIILTIALLTTPSVIAKHWTNSLSKMMLLATVVCVTCSIVGLLLSYGGSLYLDLNIPSGPVIILVVVSVYVFSSVALKIKREKIL